MQQKAKKVEPGVKNGDDAPKPAHVWVNVERGLYKEKNSGRYYERIRSGEKNTWLSLDTTKLTEARERLDARRAARAAHKLGLKVKEPGAKVATVNDVLDRFEKDGCPSKAGHKRQHPEQAQASLPYLRRFFGETPAEDLKQSTLDAYHDWRIREVKKGDGHRTTDLDIQVLSVAMTWAKRKDLIANNPIEKHQRYTDPKQVRHAREKSPEDMGVVHTLASEFFSRPNSEVLGWQMLFAAMTGQRTEELLSLRSDAAAEEPGWLTKDGKTLYVRRVKNRARENPCAFVHDGLQQLMQAHAKWKAKRYPDSPWFFPGRDGKKVVSEGALAKALRGRKAKRKRKKGSGKTLLRKLQGTITPHGLRALYVKVRRSNGITDSQIAWELNHTSGVATLEEIYGGIPPHWMDGSGPKLAWIPGTPAWEGLKY